MNDQERLAPCGIDCNTCPQRPEHCDGCHADSDHLWHAGCKIRVCCRFEKDHPNCSACKTFPCQAILDFENDKWPHHTEAIARLRQLHLG